jgi:YceI-like domain
VSLLTIAVLYKLGPENGTLSVRTGRTGAAAKAGHDLLLHVTNWEATVDLGERPSLSLEADGASLRVREGTGGMQALGEDDVASIHQSIDDDVLREQRIAFRSTRAEPGPDGRLRVEGDLTIAGTSRPIAFDLDTVDGRIRGSATVKQSNWGIKQFSILFGALKVADEVEVAIDAAQSR